MDAFGELFSRYAREAWRAAYAVCGSTGLADEVVQDAFERVVGKFDQFDAKRGFGPWLHRIVMNRALDVLRRERRFRASEPGEPRAPESTGGSGFLDLIAGLEAERRVVVVLRYGLGYPPAAIAELLDLPVGTVHSRLARALRDLRAQTEASLSDG